ncbi:DUF4367 domain-containing protein [Anaeromassilibacillus senegalensis]|uniref:DUF4367 domain-containing protein n=1 Tax=Anaeromassilibacillus senegalensis TaxID=1673717 RepID=UPI000681A990|nr:DUF4367 domain-containing protein [Anaeromassilibacillus senegalensis]
MATTNKQINDFYRSFEDELTRAYVAGIPSVSELDALYPTTPELDAKMWNTIYNDSIASAYKRKRLSKRIAIAFIAALLAALIAAMTVTAVREAIIKYYDGLYFSISDLQEPIDSSIDKNEIFNKNMTVKDIYVPYELPHGYMPTLYGPLNREPGEAFEIEYRSQTKRMIFKQRAGVVDEATLSTPIIVDGQTYYYADDVPDPKYPCELMWQADGIIFSIGGDLEASEMIEMAKSVALK